MSLYKVCLDSIELFGNHGVLEEEKKNGQTFYIDIEFLYYKNNIGDDIEAALDYSQVYLISKKVFESRRYNLLENLATDISNSIIKKFSNIKKLTVSVKKKNPPIGGMAKSVTVTVSVKENKKNNR